VRTHSLELYTLGLRPEYFPNFGSPEEWEMDADQNAAAGWPVEDLVALLRRPGRVHLLLRPEALPEIEAALGRPLRRVESHGRGEHEVVLVTND
jgi:hypothetical protein